MKHSVFVALFATTVPLILFSAEPSAFGAGNLSSPKPYGLTSREKTILENKVKLHKVVIKSNNQANEVDSLRERIDGLQSIIENLSRQAHNNKITIRKMEEKSSNTIANSDEYQLRLSDLVQQNTQSIQENKEFSLKEYASKLELETLVEDINKFKELVAKELKNRTKSTRSSKSTVDIYSRAKAYYKKKFYTKAILDYELLIKRNYKPAYAHYMIGEMNFARKNYANAITYFKKSSALYSKASYMPNLMLHTGISMQKTGDTGHARAFFKAVVAKYPNSKESIEAKNYLGL